MSFVFSSSRIGAVDSATRWVYAPIWRGESGRKSERSQALTPAFGPAIDSLLSLHSSLVKSQRPSSTISASMDFGCMAKYGEIVPLGTAALICWSFCRERALLTGTSKQSRRRTVFISHWLPPLCLLPPPPRTPLPVQAQMRISFAPDATVGCSHIGSTRGRATCSA